MAGTMGGLPGVKGTGVGRRQWRLVAGAELPLPQKMSLPTCGSLFQCPPTFRPAGGSVNCHCLLGALLELINMPAVTWASVLCVQEQSSRHPVLVHTRLLSHGSWRAEFQDGGAGKAVLSSSKFPSLGSGILGGL